MNSKFKKYHLISTGTFVPNFLKEDRKNNKTYDIIINDLRLKALVGIHEHEKNKKQKISINLILQAVDNLKLKEDDINNVVSYEHIVNDIKYLVNSGHVGLLETLAENISKLCFKDNRVINATIRIEKLEVFKETESVGIEIFRMKKSINKKTGKILKINK